MTTQSDITQAVNKMLFLFRRQTEDEVEKQGWQELLALLTPEEKEMLISFRKDPGLPVMYDKIIQLLTLASRAGGQLPVVLETYLGVLTRIINDICRSENKRRSRKDYDMTIENEPPPQREQPAMVTCFFQGEMEEEALIGKPIAISFLLSREQLSSSLVSVADTTTARVISDEPLLVHCRPVRNFVVLAADWQTVDVPEEGAPLTLLFNGKCTQLGPCGLAIDVWQGKLLLCTVTLRPECISSRVNGRLYKESVRAFAMQPLKIPVHQLHITERMEGPDLYYTFYLDAPQWNILRKYESTRINSSLQTYLKSLYSKMNNLWSTVAGNKEEAEKLARDIGADLFTSLLPKPLQEALWANKDQIKSLMIITEESMIPWELILVKDPERRSWLPKDKFLGDMGVTRWLFGWQPSQQFVFTPGRLFSVIPKYVNRSLRLPAAPLERSFLENLLGVTSYPAEPGPLRKLLKLEAGFDLLHFTCHGAVDKKDDGRVKLVLQDELDGEDILPSYLLQTTVEQSGPFAEVEASRPIVVLNTCHSGVTDSLAGAGGFAKAFLDAGAGSFVGALWSINDEAAFLFISSWYKSLCAGKTLSEATVDAREAAKAKFGVTYLAYTVYGYPEATLSVLH